MLRLEPWLTQVLLPVLYRYLLRAQPPDPYIPLQTPAGYVSLTAERLCRQSHSQSYRPDLYRRPLRLLHAFVTDLGQYDVILGKPWLNVHNPSHDWPSDRVCFDSAYCRTIASRQ